MNVVVNGLMTSYQKAGKGKTIVLLHGWGDSSSTFQELIAALKDDYQLLSLNLPGFGGTEAPPRAWKLADYVNFVNLWLAKIQSGNVFAFVGHSYGGAVLIKGIGEGELKSEKLVLIASAGIRGRNKVRKKALWALAKTVKLPLYLLPKTKRNALKQQTYKKIGSDILTVPNMQGTFKAIIGEDVQVYAKKITVPTILIYGSDDKETPVQYGRRLSSSIKDSKLEIVEGAGHFVHKDEFEKVKMMIIEFLAGKHD